jgi:hypothetical protein
MDAHEIAAKGQDHTFTPSLVCVWRTKTLKPPVALRLERSHTLGRCEAANDDRFLGPSMPSQNPIAVVLVEDQKRCPFFPVGRMRRVEPDWAELARPVDHVAKQGNTA